VQRFFNELKRRNVIRVGAAYALVAWIIAQAMDMAANNFGAPEWVMQITLIILVLGLPVTLLLSWAFELTSQGFKKTEQVRESESETASNQNKINRFIFGALIIALAFIAYDKLNLTNGFVLTETQESRSSIAVLPFVNMSDDPSNIYFSDGISEEILNVLAKYQDLRVAARTSSFQFKGENRDITEIGLKLNVDYVLEGSVRKYRNKVRITAQLIETQSGFHLWSETYDRELENVFAIQDEISQAIGIELLGKLDLKGKKDTFPKVIKSTNTEAYEEYLLGKFLMNQRTKTSLEEAVEHFSRAINLDENYTPPYAYLMITYGLLVDFVGYGDMTTDEVLELGTPFVERALSLAPNLAETQAALYWLKMLNQDFEEAWEALSKAVELNPSFIDARIWQSNELAHRQQFKEQIEFSSESVQLDPLNIVINFNHVQILARVGRYDEAKELADRIYSINPAWGQKSYGIIEESRGNIPSVVAFYLEGLGEDAEQTVLLENLKFIFFKIGLEDEAVRINPRWYDSLFYTWYKYGAEELRSLYQKHQLTNSKNSQLLSGYADANYFLGDFETAITYYERAWDNNPNYVDWENLSQVVKYIYFAHSLREVGNLEKAEEQISIAENGVAKMEAVGFSGYDFYLIKTWIFLYRGNYDEALDALEHSSNIGMQATSEELKENRLAPLMYPLLENKQFKALLNKISSTTEKNRQAVVALICSGDFPDIKWRPMKDTCEGHIRN
jgi:TolB-like protein